MSKPPEPLSNSSPLLRRALRAQERGDLDKAEKLFRAQLTQRADDFDAWYGLGDVNYRRGRLDAALACFQAALKVDLTRADGFASLGLVFHSLRQFERALVSYEEGLRLTPEAVELRNRRGVVLLDLRRPREALDDFDRVLAREPAHPDALGNRGNALLRLNRVDEALAAYDLALQSAPSNARLLTNRAAALRRLDRPQEALMSAAQALQVAPGFAPARFVEGLARLTLGDFRAGWRGYEARWEVGFLAAQRRNFAAPLWQGERELDGQTILLHGEQGFGDALQFVRYAPLVAASGPNVVLEVGPKLVRLLSRQPGVQAVVAHGETLPPFDTHCPLLSLPLAFGTELATIPADIPYIEPAAADVALWRERLQWDAASATSRPRLRVGLAWSGERSHDNDLNRSMRLETLAPILDLADIEFVSLQPDIRDEDAAFLRAHPRIEQFGPQFRDFGDTAAAIALLDLVISVDTAVAHLAGAMGRPLYLLLPFAADFRWLRERKDSPWYPSARLFRQPRFGDWESVVNALGHALIEFSAAGSKHRLSA